MIVLTVFAVCMLFHAAVVRHVTDATPRPRLAAVGGSTPAAFSAHFSGISEIESAWKSLALVGCYCETCRSLRSETTLQL